MQASKVDNPRSWQRTYASLMLCCRSYTVLEDSLSLQVTYSFSLTLRGTGRPQGRTVLSMLDLYKVEVHSGHCRSTFHLPSTA